MSLGLRLPTPNRQANMRRSNYATHPLRLCVERRMAEEPSDERRHFVLSHARHNQAVASMTELPRVEIAIASEECNISNPTQKKQDLIILQTFPAKVNANLPGCDSGCSQHGALTVENIFIENDQAWARSPELSVLVYSAE